MIAGTQHNDVVLDHVLGGDCRDVTVTPGAHGRSIEQPQFGQGVPGAQFLDNADGAVAQDDAGEEGIGAGAGNQDQDEANGDDRVNRGKNIGPNDLCKRSSGTHLRRIGEASSDTLADLSGRQTYVRGAVFGRSGFGHVLILA